MRRTAMAQHTDIDPSALGPNMWLIDEMFRRFQEDPGAGGPGWQGGLGGVRPALGRHGAGGPAWKEFCGGFTPAWGNEEGEALRGEAGEALRVAGPHPTPRSAPP